MVCYLGTNRHPLRRNHNEQLQRSTTTSTPGKSEANVRIPVQDAIRLQPSENQAAW